MSIYRFASMPTQTLPSVQSWVDAFTATELDEIVRIGDSLALDKATVEGPQSDAIRKSKTGWISLNEETAWLYERLASAARELNASFFRFDLEGFHEDFQYTVYGSDEDHYTWHVDHGSHRSRPPRKLSLVLQLSHPHEYEGGDLETMVSNTPVAVEKRRGIIHAFPSYVLHRVTPVTAGTRRTLVVWTSGPPFR